MSSGPPEFEEELADYTAELGETVKLACRVTGTPKPIVSWYKGTCQGLQTDPSQEPPPGVGRTGAEDSMGSGQWAGHGEQETVQACSRANILGMDSEQVVPWPPWGMSRVRSQHRAETDMPEGSRESTRTTEGATGRHLGAGEACELNGPGRVLITLHLQGHGAQALHGSGMGAAKVKGGQVSPRPVSIDTATGLGS